MRRNRSLLWLLSVSVAYSCAVDAPDPEPERGEPVIRTSGTFTSLHTFAYATDGAEDRGSLVQVGTRLYGLAGEAGPNGNYTCGACYSDDNWSNEIHLQECPGTLFSIDMSGSDFRVEHAFTSMAGSNSHTGSACGSGSIGSGSAYPQNADGYHPYGSLVVTSDGKLHGVTREGGIPYKAALAGMGVLFTYDPTGSGSYVVNHSFCQYSTCSDGELPEGTLAVLADGHSVAGTTSKGGDAAEDGTVFVWDGSHFHCEKLSGLTAGGNPYGGLTAWAGSGSAFPAGAVGMTYSGSAAGSANAHGNAFYVNTTALAAGSGSDCGSAGTTVTAGSAFPAYTQNSFGNDNTPIQAPYVFGGAIYYPRQWSGSAGAGSIFVSSGIGSFSTEVDFADVCYTGSDPHPSCGSNAELSNSTGAFPNGTVVVKPVLGSTLDIVYGTAMSGGTYGHGAIYSDIPPASPTLLFSFQGSSGNQPYGGVTYGSDGALYGASFGSGVIYRYQP